MRIRSRSILASAILLLVAAAGLALLLERDGEVGAATEDVLAAEPGDDVTLKATVRDLKRSEWSQVLPPTLESLSNHTYMAAQSSSAWIVVTHEKPISDEDVMVIQGQIVGQTELENGITLVLIRVDSLQPPIVFR